MKPFNPIATTSNSPVSPVVIDAQGLGKQYRRGVETIHALSNVSFQVQESEFIAIIGPSGAGKTTLLHLLGAMDTPTSGTLLLDGQNVKGLADHALTGLRRETVGFVFQHFGLLPTLTALENVMLPLLFSHQQGRVRGLELLARVGMAHRHGHRPHELSGGEMQRVAIARALINSPRLLLADEPTGNLDSASGAAIISLFTQLNREGLTVLVVTHNSTLANVARRQLTLQDGQLVADSASAL